MILQSRPNDKEHLMVDAHTRVCCIIGDPVEHSLSPAMHNAAYRSLGLNWVYTAFRVSDVKAALAGVRGLGIRGVSVTIPHKVAAIEHLDRLDPVAEWIGSVNTVVNDDGVLTGLNTDGEGAVKALLDAGAPLKGARILMLGSGGAARAIAFTLAARAQIQGLVLLGVIEKELAELADEVRQKTGVKTEGHLISDELLARVIPDADLLIQCSPIGMHPKEDETIVPARLLRPGLRVMDIVYNPRETRLLKEARQAGCPVVYGLEMLLNQGVLQFEAWTKTAAPVAVMRKALEEGLAGHG